MCRYPLPSIELGLVTEQARAVCRQYRRVYIDHYDPRYCLWYCEVWVRGGIRYPRVRRGQQSYTPVERVGDPEESRQELEMILQTPTAMILGWGTTQRCDLGLIPNDERLLTWFKAAAERALKEGGEVLAQVVSIVKAMDRWGGHPFPDPQRTFEDVRHQLLDEISLIEACRLANETKGAGYGKLIPPVLLRDPYDMDIDVALFRTWRSYKIDAAEFGVALTKAETEARRAHRRRAFKRYRNIGQVAKLYQRGFKTW